MRQEVIYEDRAREIERISRQLAAVKSLEAGKTYVLYTKRANKTGEGFKGIVKRERRLVSHHSNYARFRKKSGFYECYTYGELLGILQKPKGVRIVKEGIAGDE